MPLLHSGTQRKHKDCSSDVSSSAVLMRHQIDDRQITHLICIRLRHVLYDFLGDVWAFYLRKQEEGGPKHAPKSHIADV